PRLLSRREEPGNPGFQPDPTPPTRPHRQKPEGWAVLGAAGLFPGVLGRRKINAGAARRIPVAIVGRGIASRKNHLPGGEWHSRRLVFSGWDPGWCRNLPG